MLDDYIPVGPHSIRSIHLELLITFLRNSEHLPVINNDSGVATHTLTHLPAPQDLIPAAHERPGLESIAAQLQEWLWKTPEHHKHRSAPLPTLHPARANRKHRYAQSYTTEQRQNLTQQNNTQPPHLYLVPIQQHLVTNMEVDQLYDLLLCFITALKYIKKE